MKRKLCLALAIAMVLSVFTSLSAFAWNKYAFDSDATPTLEVVVTDWSEMATEFGLPAGTGFYAVDLMIADNEGFMSLDCGVVFDTAKVQPYGTFATGTSLSHTSTENNDIVNASAVNYTVSDGGVMAGYRYSNMPTQKANMNVVYGIAYLEGTKYSLNTVAAGTKYAEDEGILTQMYFIAEDGVVPTAADFPIKLNVFCGKNKDSENLMQNTTVVNPYVAGGTTEPETKDITVTYGEGGAVEVNGAVATSGQVFTVGEDETISASIVPAEGYYCSSYTLDGTEVANTEVGTIANLTVAESLDAQFTAIPLDPVIGNEVEVDGTYYADIDNFENIGDRDFGFKLTVTRKVVNGLTIERDEEVYYCSCKGKEGANSLGQFGAIIEVIRAEECDYTVEAYIA